MYAKFRPVAQEVPPARPHEVGHFATPNLVALPNSRRPQKLRWEQAGGLPLVGLTAYQSVIKIGQLRAGEAVLILGASGGVGSTAIQLAKHAGATVIAVASAKNAGLMTELRADFPLDYQAGPVAAAVQEIAPQGVDLLFDAVGGDTLTQSLGALRPTGRLVSVVNGGKMLAVPTGVAVTYVFGQGSIPDLDHLRELADTGKPTVAVARTYPLADVRQAFAQLETRHTAGKTVLVP